MVDRRQVIKAGTAIGAGALAGCSMLGAESSERSLTYKIYEGSPVVPAWLAGQREQAWEKCGVKLDIEAVPFGQWNRSLVSGSSNMGSISPITFIKTQPRENTSTRLLGGETFPFNRIFARKGSSIDEPQDLEGKKVGVPFWSSGTTRMARAMLKEDFDFDLKNDTDATAAEPPVLWELLTEKEELDAILEFVSWTIRGIANDDVKTVMDLIGHYRDKTGNPPIVTYHAARADWFESNTSAAKCWLDGYQRAAQHTRENVTDEFKSYGRFAGLDSQAEIDVLKKQFEKGNITFFDVSQFDQSVIDSQWKLFRMMKRTGVLEEEIPDKSAAIPYSQL